MSNLIPAAPAIEGIPVSPLAYLVVAGEYDEFRVIACCADERDAETRADLHNRSALACGHLMLPGDAARVEPVEFVPASRSGDEPNSRGVATCTNPEVHDARFCAGCQAAIYGRTGGAR